MGRIARILLSGALTLLLVAVAAPAAHGAFHFMQTREVGAGTNADPMDEFVELQMYAAGQNLVQGHYLNFYGADAGFDGQYQFPSSPANGDDQRTILVAGPTGPAAPDFTQDMNISGGGGAVCYLDMMFTGPIDCVSWGNYDGDPAPPSPTGTNVAAGGIPENQSIERSIAPGCPTTLDPADDTNNSAADFAVQTTPTPRNNSVAPTETLCLPPGGGAATAPGNPASPINPAGNVRKRKCKKAKRRSAVAAKKKCKKR